MKGGSKQQAGWKGTKTAYRLSVMQPYDKLARFNLKMAIALIGYFVKFYLQLSVLILSLCIASCLRPATPDDDLVSGILLGDIAAVHQALDHGAKVTRVYQDGMTPLMYACGESNNYHGESGADMTVTVKSDLKKSQTSIDAQAGNTHFSHSLQTVRGNTEMVELLIARGADVHAKNKEGQTALSLAIRNNLPEIAEILRKAGAK